MAARADLVALGEDLNARLDTIDRAVVEELARAERSLRALQGRVAELRRQRDSIRAMRELSPHRGTHLKVVREPAYPTKPSAVMGLLRANPDREFRLIEIREELIAHGWMASDRASIHALEVAVRNLEQRGLLQRPRKGVYRLVVPLYDDRASADTGVQTR